VPAAAGSVTDFKLIGFTWFADGVKRLGLPVPGGGLLVIAGIWLTTHHSERTA